MNTKEEEKQLEKNSGGRGDGKGVSESHKGLRARREGKRLKNGGQRTRFHSYKKTNY